MDMTYLDALEKKVELLIARLKEKECERISLEQRLASEQRQSENLMNKNKEFGRKVQKIISQLNKKKEKSHE